LLARRKNEAVGNPQKLLFSGFGAGGKRTEKKHRTENDLKE
jgi:hypothetical protein